MTKVQLTKPILTLLAGVLTISARSQVSAADLNDLTYTVGENDVTIRRCNRLAMGHLEIPATIEGKPVS